MGCAGPGLQGGKSTWAAPSAVMEAQSGRLGRADGQRGQPGVVVARFGAHLDGRHPLEADEHCIRGACSRRREVNELVLAELLVSTPCGRGGRGRFSKCPRWDETLCERDTTAYVPYLRWRVGHRS